jgi:hypothetical protein
MSQHFSREIRAQKVSSSMYFTPVHREQSMKASRVAMSRQLLEILQHCQATDFVKFLIGDELWFFLEYPHYDMMSGPRPEMNYQKHA